MVDMIYEIGPDSAWQTHSLTLSVPKKPRRSPKCCGLLPNTPFRLRKIENHPYSKGRRNPAGKSIEFLKVDFRQCDWSREGQGVHRLHQLKLSFAAIHRGAAAPTRLLYDLCPMPQYVNPLGEEIQATLAEHGSSTERSLIQLGKMVSFMKESQRFNPLLLSASSAKLLLHRADSVQSHLNEWSQETTRSLMDLSFPRERPSAAYP